MFFDILGNLYPTHPLHIDITDTIENIDRTIAQDLYTCYRTLYQPGSIVLFAVGEMEPEKSIELIRKSQEARNSPPRQEIVCYFPENTKEAIR